MMKRHQAFTLLEVLAVLAIIGILAGIFGNTLLKSIRSAELRETATQVAADLRQARSQAQRGSSPVEVILPGTSGGSSYQISGQNRTLPSQITIICQRGCSASSTSVIYRAPYGELDNTGNVFIVRSSLNGIAPLEIRVVGVTGKVIVTGSS